MPSGRPTKLNDALIEKANHYIDHYDEYDHAIPSVVGMAVVLNVGKTTLYRWAEDETNIFRDILAKCNDFQEHTLINKGLRNEINPTIAKLALGKHGYSENVKNENTGPNGGPQEHKWTVEFINASPESKPET